MLFNSLQFVIFFSTIVAAYFLLVQRYRWILLLVGSYFFYMCWNAEYVFLIFFSTLIDYFAALKMAAAPSKNRKKMYLGLSLVSNLSLLFVFKYFNFFRDLFGSLPFSQGGMMSIPQLDLLLPVGISFYTFQTLSYSIDVYRGDKEPEKHFGLFALYVSFFPQLVAGPIERSTSLMPQFHNKVDFDYARVRNGLGQMLWGFFKKIVIADRLAILVDAVYSQPQAYSPITLSLATVFFAFQIYCDFSGYSDIAIGSARVLGFRLRTNFKTPYMARSISDFWSRWHISLSSWFRDYLYIPLGGNRVVKWRWYYNLMVVFLVSGLWHGANMTFIVWGALHGSYLVFSILTEKTRNRAVELVGLKSRPFLHSCLQMSITFGLVLFAWIFFRAASITDALYICNAIFAGLPEFFSNIASVDSGWFRLRLGEIFSVMHWYDFVLSLLLIGFLIAADRYGRTLLEYVMSIERPSMYRWALYYTATMSILLFGKFGASEFIYFQF